MTNTPSTTIPKPISKPKQSWKSAIRAYGQPKILSMLLLGFASGLPFMMFFSKLSRWLADAGIEKSTIGFIYWISLAYAVKFLWAPVIDRAPVPFLTKKFGQRRSWMMVSIIGTAIGLFLISRWGGTATSPLGILILGSFVLTYSGASLDISIDAWRIESAPNDEQANMAAVYQLGYRFAIIGAGLGMAAADQFGWPMIYMGSAFLMAANIILILFIKEPPSDKRPVASSFKESFRHNVVDPYLNFVSRFKWWTLIIFLLVALYRLSDFTMGVMAQPFYADLGFTKTQVGLITAGFGPWPLLFGAFLSGFACVRFGLMRTLLAGALITIVTNGAFAWLATYSAPTTAQLFVTIGADNIAGGFVVTVFIAYMSSLVDLKFAATQYALLSSAFALFCKVMAGFSGVLYDAVGAFQFFVITAAYGIPAILLILYLMRFGPSNAKGERVEG